MMTAELPYPPEADHEWFSRCPSVVQYIMPQYFKLIGIRADRKRRLCYARRHFFYL